MGYLRRFVKWNLSRESHVNALSSGGGKNKKGKHDACPDTHENSVIV